MEGVLVNQKSNSMNLARVFLSSAVGVFGAISFSTSVFAATLSIGGNYRFGTNLFSNLDLVKGTPQGGSNSSTFIEHRALLRPEVVIDDRFQVKSELSLLGSQSLLASNENDVPENFGSVLGSSGGIYVRKAWLEWASDWGIFRVGRQPKQWGLGIVHNAGKDPLDDFGTIVDRAGFQALLGNLGVNLAYEKGAEKVLNRDSDDTDTYEISLDYSNPESFMDVGLMYTRNVRTGGAATGLKSSHDLSIFVQKKWKMLQAGAEFASMSQDSSGTASGFLTQLDYQPGSVKFGFDVALASASGNNSFKFHPNYQPMMILFRQTVGATKALSSVRGGTSGSTVGSTVAEGDGAGALLTKARILYSMDQGRYQFGTDLGWAQLIRQGSNVGKALGFEVDLHFSQKWYENFSTHYGLGVLFPGKAFGESVQTTWGLQIRGALEF
jgi:hypothetical protein